MDKDSIADAVNHARGVIKDAVDKPTGDAQLQSKGAIAKAEGMLHTVLRRLTDAVKNITR